jgi:hypothetical protein
MVSAPAGEAVDAAGVDSSIGMPKLLSRSGSDDVSEVDEGGGSNSVVSSPSARGGAADGASNSAGTSPSARGGWLVGTSNSADSSPSARAGAAAGEGG